MESFLPRLPDFAIAMLERGERRFILAAFTTMIGTSKDLAWNYEQE
jgi:hypothetical protein